jgi:hypothetical protein
VPPTGTPQQESLLATLLVLGNRANPDRHCELTAAARSSGVAARPRTWFLDGGAPGGLWTTDVPGESQVGTVALRAAAGGPITFTCATVGSGVRLGADRDEDGVFNAGDCAPGDAAQWQRPGEVTGVRVGLPAHLTWDAQASADPTPVTYEIAGALLSTLPAGGVGAAGCLAGALAIAEWDDARPDPSAGNGYYYLVRATKPCGHGGFGPGRSAMEGLACSP